jgi:GAF domain-containing protein
MNQGTTEIELEPTQTLDTILHQILNQALIAAEAEAGSLMLVDDKRGILQIKARLGKPRPGRKTEPEYKIGETGIASRVVMNKRAYLCPNVETDSFFTPSSSGKNFSSVLSVPIVYEDKVLAVINADAEKKSYFTWSHREKLETIAQQVAAPIAERVRVLKAKAEVGIELSCLPGEGGVDHVLKRIAQLAVPSLGGDWVTIYPYDQGKDEFLVEGTGPIVAPEVWAANLMRHKVYAGEAPWMVVKKHKSGFYSDVQKEDSLTRPIERPGDTPRLRFVEREGIKSMAALLLPFSAAELKEEVVGVMFVNYRTHHEFNVDEASLFATFADYAAIAILNARREEQRRVEARRRADDQQC